MGGLCNSVTGFASLFIILAFAVAVIETGLALYAKWKAFQEARKAHEGYAAEGILDALAKVLAALKDLPAWVAIFLAAMALVWTATSAPGICPAS